MLLVLLLLQLLLPSVQVFNYFLFMNHSSLQLEREGKERKGRVCI